MIPFDEEKQNAFDESVRPAMKWIAENCHPHTKIIIESNCAELVEGINIVKTDDYLFPALTQSNTDGSDTRIKELENTLSKIIEWKAPETGEFWDEEKTRPCSYETLYGSNGIRDYFRRLAESTLFKDEQLKKK